MASHGTLFPTDAPANEWLQFPAAGFSEPACGFIRRRANPATFGMPLGAIDTGCLGIDTDGTLGLCSIFNSYVPMRGPLKLPFLGMSAGEADLGADHHPLRVEREPLLPEPGDPRGHPLLGPLPGRGHRVRNPRQPGGYRRAGVVAVHRGRRGREQHPGRGLRGAPAQRHERSRRRAGWSLSFPGPTQEEAQVARGSPPSARRARSPRSASGRTPGCRWPKPRSAPGRSPSRAGSRASQLTTEANNRVGYAIGVVGEAKVQFRRGLGREREAWEKIGTGSADVSDPDGPEPLPGGGVSRGSRARRRCCDWCWRGTRRCGSGRRTTTIGTGTATRFADALEVARFVAANHASLLRGCSRGSRSCTRKPVAPGVAARIAGERPAPVPHGQRVGRGRSRRSGTGAGRRTASSA